MKQVYNPYLPSWEYVPDGEPHIFNDRVYVYGSHDQFGGHTYCMGPYVCWSAPVDDLADWTYHGVIYTGEHDALNETGKRLMFAPDVVEKGGKYYLFYGLDSSIAISVAVANRPEGPFEFYGNVHHQDGQILGLKKGDIQQFDPGVFKDDDGRVYLYSGFSTTPEVALRIKKKFQHLEKDINIWTSGNFVMELEEDMVTLKTEPKQLLPGVSNAQGTGFEGHEFFEASSMRKFNGKYYAIYSSVQGHELCYATSNYPDRDFTYQGVLHSNGNIGLSEQPLYYYGNNHGSVIEIKGSYYVFGHRHTHISQYQRQGVAEKLKMNEDGTFNQAEMTSCGLNGQPLAGQGEYPAYIACVLQSKQGACKADMLEGREDHPAITQNELQESYITNLQDGSVVGYKYFDFKELKSVGVQVKASDACSIAISTQEQGEVVAVIEISPSEEWEYYTSGICELKGISALYFTVTGKGQVMLKSFVLN